MIVTLNRVLHRNLRLNPYVALCDGMQRDQVKVVLSEFCKLTTLCPIVFTKFDNHPHYQCHALLGLQPNENLFWQQEAWLGSYIPAVLDSQPFTALDMKSSIEDEHRIGFEQGHIGIGGVGERLFDRHGRPTRLLRDKELLATKLVYEQPETTAWLEYIDELDLIAPLHIRLQFADGRLVTLPHLYSIDERKVSALSTEQLAILHGRNWLSYIYYVLASNNQFCALIERKNQRLHSDCD